MGLNFSRLLRDDDLVEHFLVTVLQVDHKVPSETIRKIVTNEKILIDFKEAENTLVSTKYRDRGCVNDMDRRKLRKQVIHELFTLSKTNKEDETILGIGGSLPKSGIKKERKAYILIGPPASGKSTIASSIAEKKHAIILDCDLAKRKFPEFEYECGASFLQEESDHVIYGFKYDNPFSLKGLSELSATNQYNIVILKIGRSTAGIVSILKYLDNMGYEIHLTLLALKRREATIRALNRFDQTKRYVPLGYVFDHVANDPLLSYYLLKENMGHLFKSTGVIDTGENADEFAARRPINPDGENPADWYEGI
ncbi:zeta toxin family protein [Chitinophaga sp. S165]|uniref:zeta toxin family protein n=1 Tax=Chitinophaga sp. S165 TaxID=2135462 RepID=UPI000D717074|nr:zeta toxin family protein [Chitinophaga sp. S165]PWV51497.1 zeta toxin [Chitinophaga sp. S165]